VPTAADPVSHGDLLLKVRYLRHTYSHLSMATFMPKREWDKFIAFQYPVVLGIERHGGPLITCCDFLSAFYSS
jgi:hypothetical protein